MLTAAGVAGCGIDPRPCGDIQADEYAAIASVWPASLAPGMYSYGACDDSGDRATADLERKFSETELQALGIELAAHGWSPDPELFGRAGGWTLHKDGHTFSASVFDDSRSSVFELTLDG